MAVQVRRAVALMLDQAGPESISIAVSSDTSAGSVVKVALRMSAARAVLLTCRGCGAGALVCSLLDRAVAPPRAADHGAAVAELGASTDRVAAMSAYLNAFLRLLDRLPYEQLDGYRAGLMSLAGDMRSHLATASSHLAWAADRRYDLVADRQVPRWMCRDSICATVYLSRYGDFVEQTVVICLHWLSQSTPTRRREWVVGGRRLCSGCCSSSR